MSDSSLTVWQDIDAAEAESRLRNLRRRDADLEIAFASQIQLQASHPDSFAVSLSLKSLEMKRDQISSEMRALLHHRINEPVTISLDGQDFHDHSASITTLGVFLLRFQKLYSSVAQSVQTGPTLRGPIATNIREATELRLAEVFPSSFGMELYVPSKLDLMGQSVASDSLGRMFDLLAASRDEKQLMEIAGILGGRVTNHLRHLAAFLSSSDASLRIAWSDYTGREHSWLASQDNAKSIVSILQNIHQVRSSEKTFTGVLVGGSLFKHNFELVDQDSGMLIEGNMISGLAPSMKKYFGSVCTITADVTEVLDRTSGDVKTYFVLTKIDDASKQLTRTSDTQT